MPQQLIYLLQLIYNCVIFNVVELTKSKPVPVATYIIVEQKMHVFKKKNKTLT